MTDMRTLVAEKNPKHIMLKGSNVGYDGHLTLIHGPKLYSCKALSNDI